MNASENCVSAGDGKIFCRAKGKGNPLLLIHGAGVDCDFFADTAEYLSENHRVITYDRRGYSRSGGSFSADFFEQQAEDAAAVLKEFSGGEKAAVIGCSAGGAVALWLARLHPELVRELVLHEPSAASLLPKGHNAFVWADKIREFIENGKPGRGIGIFISSFGESDERAKPKPEETLLREEKNLHVFMENEFIPFFYGDTTPEISKDIPVTVCTGDCHKESYFCELAKIAAEKYSAGLVHFPGFHNCAYDLPFDFAVGIEGILSLQKNTDERSENI